MIAGLGFGILTRDENGNIWLQITAEPEETGLVVTLPEQNSDVIEGQFHVVKPDEISILDLIDMHQAEQKKG